MRRIVVGVDGSSAAAAALSLACDEAVLHDAQLSVVHVREREFAWAHAQSVLDMAVNECRDRTMRTVTGALASGPAWSALAEASRYANLVCVGSRGRSGFKTAVFGSVALRVAEHADCPVAITHPRATGH